MISEAAGKGGKVSLCYGLHPLLDVQTKERRLPRDMQLIGVVRVGPSRGKDLSHLLLDQSFVVPKMTLSFFARIPKSDA